MNFTGAKIAIQSDYFGVVVERYQGLSVVALLRWDVVAAAASYGRVVYYSHVMIRRIGPCLV